MGQTIRPFSLGDSWQVQYTRGFGTELPDVLEDCSLSTRSRMHFSIMELPHVPVDTLSSIFLVTGLAGVGVHRIGQRDHRASIHLIPMDGGTWTQGGHTWGHSSSHCQYSHIHQWPGHTSLPYLYCCETGEKMYRNWRRICWRFVTAVKVRDVEIHVESLSVLSCYNKRICHTHIIPYFLAHTCHRWEWEPCWWKSVHSEWP